MKVLILEDEIPAQMQIKKLLNINYPEFEIKACHASILSAAEWLKNNEVDLIFMDVQMPIMDGIQACRLIHQDTCNKQTPIIAVTAHASPGERERLMANGMDEYLSKPIDEVQLKRLLLQFSDTTAVTSAPLMRHTFRPDS